MWQQRVTGLIDCGDCHTMYTNVESWCIPETNIIVYVSYTSIKKKKLGGWSKEFVKIP